MLFLTDREFQVETLPCALHGLVTQRVLLSGDHPKSAICSFVSDSVDAAAVSPDSTNKNQPKLQSLCRVETLSRFSLARLVRQLHLRLQYRLATMSALTPSHVSQLHFHLQ